MIFFTYLFEGLLCLFLPFLLSYSESEWGFLWTKTFLFLVILVNLAEFLKQYVMPSPNGTSGHGGSGKGTLLTLPALLLGSDLGFIRVGHMSVDLVTSTMTFTDPLWVPNPAAAAAAAAEAAAQGEEDEAGDGSYLRATFPSSIKDFSKETKDCGPSDNFETTASLCRLFGTHVQLKVTESKKENHITCYHIVWAALSKDFIPQNCFELDEAYWYGGPEVSRQMYPIEKSSIPMVPFVPGFDPSLIHSNLSLGPILERYWINSQGTGIVVDNLIPLHSFTFDLANIYALPFNFSSSIPMKNPSEYLTKLAEFAYVADHKAVVPGAFQSQKVPLFVETVAKNATWDYNSGLKNVIPNILTLGILGYPFILPSAIGGSNGTDSPPASKDLFIRWAQMATYFPIMHFSIPPWYFDEETVKITQSLVKIHQRNVVPLLKHLMKEAEVTGAPIIRPVWWIAPEDPIALRIDCEFLLGDRLLVAPILDPGNTSRNVYLPHGQWTDVLSGKRIEGGRWYKDYKVQLHQIATFQKLKSVV
ncbi:SITS-binding protein [Acanthosepion pharaonis]|uniref:SITS-binding protein n=1 Tax=Acanthosepion pharaonis TaxID=158019 RepID=A0A812DEB1_ACAPH|nr:SITS-binding protein [Sepia pharaonis]